VHDLYGLENMGSTPTSSATPTSSTIRQNH
jgi:hypothetical protein